MKPVPLDYRRPTPRDRNDRSDLEIPNKYLLLIVLFGGWFVFAYCVCRMLS